MTEPKFILFRKILKEQVNKLKNLGLKISYSYKTNKEVGNVLQDLNIDEFKDINFSIHSNEEIEMIKPEHRKKIWFFTQAESEEELKEILNKGIINFVIDNKIDLQRILNVIKDTKTKINLSLRMKFKEHRIGSGKYFVYGMSSNKINKIIGEIRNNGFIGKLGVHIHRKSQNTSEWDIKSELRDSLTEKSLNRINFLNFGGGLPIKYRSYNMKIIGYIFSKIKEAKDWLNGKGIESYIEPGRFLAAPCIKLETEIIQVQEKNIVINTTIYNCALDCVFTGTKMLVENELDEDKEGSYFLIKGNSPTRDDIFRYKVKLNPDNVKVGNKIIFLNAGAYNYTTDFFGYRKLATKIID